MVFYVNNYIKYFLNGSDTYYVWKDPFSFTKDGVEVIVGNLEIVIRLGSLILGEEHGSST